MKEEVIELETLLLDKTDENNFNIEDEKEESSDDFIDIDTNQKLYSSLYYRAFTDIKEAIVKKSNSSTKPNSFYSEEILKYIFDYLLRSFYALWSAAGIARFGYARYSNATAENLFKIKKNTELNGEKKIPIPRFIQKCEESIQFKLKERTFSTKTTRRHVNEYNKKGNKETKVKKLKTIKKKSNKVRKSGKRADVEVWIDKKSNKNEKISNRYLTQSKYLQCKTDLQDCNKNIIKTYEVLKKLENKTKKKAKTVNKDVQLTHNINNAINEDVTISTTKESYDKYTKINDTNILFQLDSYYPSDFPNLYKKINGFIIDKNGFSTLSPYQNPNQYLDDSIMNSFFSLLPQVAQSKNMLLICYVICFDTLFYDKIIRNKTISEGFLKWAKNNLFLKKNIWFLPINYRNHWTLLTVLLNEKSIIYFDSLHGDPASIIIDALCTFLQNEVGEDIAWNEWNLYIPKDIPS